MRSHCVGLRQAMGDHELAAEVAALARLFNLVKVSAPDERQGVHYFKI